MLFGLAHSIVFIPVFLTLLSCGSTKAKKKPMAVPDVIPKLIMLEDTSMAYDNYAFKKDHFHVCRQIVNTQSTQIYFSPNNKILSNWCRDLDFP